jgi:sugar (pentulose or hexulose) kinase
MNIVVSLDIGTSKVAAVAFDPEGGRNVALVSMANESRVSGLAPGIHEQDPRTIYGYCLELLKRLLDSGAFAPADVEAIALTGQMHGIVLVDSHLDPLTDLITWCDQRTVALTSSIDRGAWPADRTGCYLHPGYGGATLAILAAEGRIPGGAIALSIEDFIAARLGGAVACEPTLAASWGILDVRRGMWDDELVDRLAIPKAVLPEIRNGSRALGPLRGGLGLPSGVPVFSPVADNQASYQGACGFEGRALLLNLGTGGQISLPCGEFAFRPGLETRPLPRGGFLFVGSSLCGGRAYAILKDFFRLTLREFAGKEFGDDELYEVMNRLASAESEALAVDTRFAGTRMDPLVRGRIGEIGIDNLTPSRLSRGVVLGMVRELTDMIPRDIDRSFDRVFAGGNAVRGNPLVRRIISSELGLPCEFAANREEAATGAALAVARALHASR